MTNLTLNELIKLANDSSVNYSVSSVGASRISFGLVNNVNGKRITISKALSQKLHLDDTAYISLVPEQNALLVSATPVTEKSCKCLLRGADKKTSYSAQVISTITTVFNLDFTQKTSLSFSDIELDVVNDIDVAVINIEPTPKATT